jgi:sporulation inhibitor KapD
VGNIHTGEVHEKLSWITRVAEIIDPRIIALTGITQEQVDAGVDLMVAYIALAEYSRKYQCLMNPVTWGGGDSELLRKQLCMENTNWIFGRRWIDTKTLFVSRQIALGNSYQGGLARSMTKLGLQFQGRKHNAMDDAYNTFIVYRRLLEEIKRGAGQ